MTEIIIPNPKPEKDCPDWIPLRDGTNTGDTIYCDRSLECRQIGMMSDYYEFWDYEKCERHFDYFCRGIKARNKDEICNDEEVS